MLAMEALMRHLLVVLTVLGGPALAQTPTNQTPMTGAEFESYVTGKTLTYASDGFVYGTEQYKAGRKVIWAFTADECREGSWYENGPQICFIYEDPKNPQCWLFYKSATGLQADFVGEGGSSLSEVEQSDGPMACMGPEVGV